MSGWTLTVRHGPRVERERFEVLDEAIAALRRRVREIQAEGGLGPVEGFREYEPEERVQARLELSARGWLRGREAGIDVMGDGALVPYAGAVRKRRLEPERDEDSFDAVRSALE